MNADDSAAGIAQSLPLGVKSSHLVGAHLLRHFATSPKASGKPRRAFVDAALAFDEIPQRLIQVLVLCRVPKHPRPFAPRPIIDFATVRRAKD